MANVVCKYSYIPDLTATPVQPIVDSSVCAITENTTIIVPQLSVSRPRPENCETTVKIKYTISQPPVGGLEIMHVYIDFYFNIVRGGYVGLAGNLNHAIAFPIADEQGVIPAESTFTYEIPAPLQALDGEYNISFWPQDSLTGEELSMVKINDVSLRMSYRSLPYDPDIGTATNIRVYQEHWARMAVKWQAATCANGKTIDHYSIAVFAVDSVTSNQISLDGGEMVSDGWRSVPAAPNTNGAWIPLVAPQPNKYLFVKIVAVSTQHKRGIVTYSSGTNGVSVPLSLDTLEDTNEVMFSFGNMRVAYNHVSAQAVFINKTGAPAWTHNDSDINDQIITQSDYDRLAAFCGASEIPNVSYQVTTEPVITTDLEGNPIQALDEWGNPKVKYTVTDPSQTMMEQAQWAALIAKV